MKKLINGKRLFNIIYNSINETLDRSYRGLLHHEIPDRIDDWEYDDPWDESMNQRNLDRLSKRLGGKKVEYSTNSGNGTHLGSEMKKIGFTPLHYQKMNGESDDSGIKYFMIDKDKINNPEIRKRFKSILNFFNYKCVKYSDNYSGGEFGYDIDGVRVALEPVYTQEVYNNVEDRTFYHATPDRSVAKILRQGLVPKDRGQLGLDRNERIYLTKNPDLHIVNELERENEMEYTILKVDLNNKPDIKLYNDSYYNGDGVYCVSYIPPSCISVLNQQWHKIDRERDVEIKGWLKDMCNSIGLECDGNNVTGEINNKAYNLNISIYRNFGFYNLRINGTITSRDKNGRERKDNIRTNGCVSFWGRYSGTSCFSYDEVKDLLIGKYIKKFLETGSKRGMGFNCYG